MRYQIHRVTTDSDEPHELPYDTKAEALEVANELNDKPVDGTAFVVKAVPLTADLEDMARKLLTLLDDEGATAQITQVPLAYLSQSALKAMQSLVSRLECDRGFRELLDAPLTEGRADVVTDADGFEHAPHEEEISDEAEAAYEARRSGPLPGGGLSR